MSEATERLRCDLSGARRKHLRPPPDLTVDAWADRYRVLSSKGGASGGQWQTSTVEVARGPMRAVHEPGVRTITLVACAQLMKTEFLLNVLGYFINLDPCPIMYVMPTVEMAEAVSKDRIEPMLRGSPVLSSLTSRKGRDSDNTILRKTFPGGQLTLVGAQSPSQLASRPIRILLADEIGRYVESAGSEGDPLGLAEERQETFASNSLSIRCSSPGIKGRCRIERSYLESDQRRPFVECPHCNTRQVLRWGDEATPWGVKWTRNAAGEPDYRSARYHCRFCGAAWTEAERLAAVRGVDWRQCRTFECCGTRHDPETDHDKDQGDSVWVWDGHVWRAVCKSCGSHAVTVEHAGFWANRIYSPFRPLSHLVKKWLTDVRHPESLKKFVNTALAETWEERGEQTDASSLVGKREPYPSRDQVPADVAALFSAVDAQRNRLEVHTIGVCRDDRVRILDYQIIQGDPTDPDTLAALDAELLRIRTREDGLKMMAEAVAVDVGDGVTAAPLYRFCGERRGRRIWATRGASDRRAPPWSKKPSVSRKHNTTFYPVGTQSIKSMLARRLAIPLPAPGSPYPPGYIHLSTTVCDQQYLEQLTSEKLVRREAPGGAYYEWICPEGARNEAWDTLVYAWAAYLGWAEMGGRIAQRAEEMDRRAKSMPEQPAATTETPVQDDPVTARGAQPTTQIVDPGKEPAPPTARPGTTIAEIAPRPQAPKKQSWLGGSGARRRWF